MEPGPAKKTRPGCRLPTNPGFWEIGGDSYDILRHIVLSLSSSLFSCFIRRNLKRGTDQFVLHSHRILSIFRTSVKSMLKITIRAASSWSARSHPASGGPKMPKGGGGGGSAAKNFKGKKRVVQVGMLEMGVVFRIQDCQFR